MQRKGTYFVSISTERDTKRPGQTEITNLEITSFVDQQILRFEIPVKDTAAVAKVETFDELVREFLLWKPKGQPAAVYQGSRLRKQEIYLDHIKTKTFIFTNGIHILFQIHIKKLEHEVELCLRMHNIQQSKTFSVSDFFCTLKVWVATHLTMLSSWFNSFNKLISLIEVLGTPSSSASRRILLRATMLPVSRSLALNTTPYVPVFYLFIYHLVIHLGRL